MAEKDEDTSGDSTDVFSSKFDPLKVLYAEGVHVPEPEAPIFDNISKFESFCLTGLQTKITDNDTQDCGKKMSTSRSLNCKDFAKSIIVGKKKFSSAKNVVNRMEKCLGPLAALYQYMEKRIKVKVHTRRVNGIRGYIEAYIVAFDTHWNLALEDCFEVWSRKVARKSIASGDDDNKRIMTEPNAGYTTVMKKKNKQMETLERHISQLLLRGEQIVSIVKME